MQQDIIRSYTGRTLDELDMAHILSGQLTSEDFRISGKQLVHQAEAAEAAGYAQLGQNLRRAAELTALSNERVLEIYTALRPGRATHRRLLELADELNDAAPLTAALIREAAQAYLERGVFVSATDQAGQAQDLCGGAQPAA